MCDDVGMHAKLESFARYEDTYGAYAGSEVTVCICVTIDTLNGILI